jgi:tripartite-type tricarboxylate transporter receptor subunit TctC
VDKLHGTFKQAMGGPGFKKSMDRFDLPLIDLNPEGLAKDMKEMSDRWRELIREAGLKQGQEGTQDG